MCSHDHVQLGIEHNHVLHQGVVLSRRYLNFSIFPNKSFQKLKL